MTSTSAASTSTSLTSNTNWSASAPPWVDVSPSSGSGDTTVTFTAQANTSGSDRSGTVTFTTTSGSPAASWTVTVTQPAVLGDDCGSSTSSYCAWSNLSTPISGQIEATGDRDWFRFITTQTGAWVFTSSKPAVNPLADPVGALYDASGVSTVTTYNGGSAGGNLQSGMSALLTAGQVYYLQVASGGASTGGYTVTAINWTLSAGLSAWTVPASGGSTATWLRTNTTWTVSGPSWVTATPSSGTGNGNVALTAQANTTGSDRIGYLTLATTNRPSIGLTVTVSQPGDPNSPALMLGWSSWSVPSASVGAASASLTANRTWAVASAPSWVSVSPSSGTGNATLTLVAQANTATSARSGAVTFTTTSGSPAATWTVTVSQPGGPAPVATSGVRLNHASA
ncbi:MAG: hypothetical protein FWD74_12425, partial [Actinomycetia bacterium]|nr:hypothetical protein [Actinomycetes bacterium]